MLLFNSLKLKFFLFLNLFTKDMRIEYNISEVNFSPSFLSLSSSSFNSVIHKFRHVEIRVKDSSIIFK